MKRIVSIRVGIPDDYNETILERALARFVERHAMVEVYVRSGCTRGFPDAIQRHELDLAVCSAARLEGVAPFLEEPTVWVAAPHLALNADEPVPLAMLERDCWWRDVAGNALDAVGRSWRIAYSSENFASVKAAIGAGLAVGILARSAVDPALSVLRENAGFPVLPTTALSLLRSTRADADAVHAMGKAILSAVHPRAKGGYCAWGYSRTGGL